VHHQSELHSWQVINLSVKRVSSKSKASSACTPTSTPPCAWVRLHGCDRAWQEQRDLFPTPWLRSERTLVRRTVRSSFVFICSNGIVRVSTCLPTYLPVVSFNRCVLPFRSSPTRPAATMGKAHSVPAKATPKAIPGHTVLDEVQVAEVARRTGITGSEIVKLLQDLPSASLQWLSNLRYDIRVNNLLSLPEFSKYFNTATTLIRVHWDGALVYIETRLGDSTGSAKIIQVAAGFWAQFSAWFCNLCAKLYGWIRAFLEHPATKVGLICAGLAILIVCLGPVPAVLIAGTVAAASLAAAGVEALLQDDDGKVRVPQ